MAGRGHDNGNAWQVVMGVVCIVCALVAIAGSGAGQDALSVLGVRGASIPGMRAGVEASSSPSGLPEATAPMEASGSPTPLWGDASPLAGMPSVSSQATQTDGQTQASQPSQSQATTSDSLPVASRASISMSEALQQAQNIRVQQPHVQDYDRGSMFGGWAKTHNQCGDGGNTRDLILARDLTDVTWTKTGCHVQSGTLHDPYTGQRISFHRGKQSSMSVQIDHVVALQDAWASGAWQWTQAKRVEYANSPDVLLAVDGPANEAKGSGIASLAGGKANANRQAWGGEVWMPGNTAYKCDYMAKRVWIKNQYGLSMTQAEKTQTVSTLTACLTQKQAQ
ncbi:HNH endonuclease family protein [Pseudoscardovia suis]|uniref:Deoxyribonuclease n=1 Tax=Pseudoscardovia suis TaxID=987063 RepID=A0A261EPP0_9BIFI|nr:HNH endonuclease family protein [Pseudoscardovia suis]OZG48820.1 deoxyribonuclease [Pseudoscardovia suis]PJJ63964.1 uncharacterized protein DUF1524 [Pseudoscardovia suis]